MKVNWFLESDIYGDDIKALVAEIERQGHGLKILSDRNHWDLNWLNLFSTRDCVIYYGGLELGYSVRRKAMWVPGIYSSVENYACHKYYPLFGNRLLNSCYVIIPYGDLLRRKDWLYKHLGIDDTIFIRPDKGTKVFTGKAIYYENFEKDLEQLGFYYLEPGELCVIAEPRNVEKEWRFLIVNGRLVAGSEYKPEKKNVFGNSIHDDSYVAIRVAEQAVANVDYVPDRAWTLDICKTVEGNFYVLEVGCFSCAGLYAMNMADVVREVSRIAWEDWKEIFE